MRRAARYWWRATARTWHATSPNGRLGVGALLVSVLWWLGLDRLVLAGVAIPWPIGLLLAAMGWARVGLAMRPMMALVALSFLYDLGGNAPLGSYMIVALATYGIHAAAGTALDLERDPFMQSALPFFSLFAGLFVLWVLASASAGHPVRLAPLLAAGFATAVAYVALAPVFNLRARPGIRPGRG